MKRKRRGGGEPADGLIDIYEPGSYEGQTLRKLCERTLNKRDWSIEELQVLEDIRRQLEGGRLICRGKPIEGSAPELLVRSGVLYVPLLFDPDIEREVRGRPEAGSLAEENGRVFVRALTLTPLLDNHGTMDAEAYAELRNRCLEY